MTDTNDQFSYNMMLAKALLQLMPASEWHLIRYWFEALTQYDQTPQELTIRNEYIWFILMMLQNGKLEEYFKRMPPPVLKPLNKALPQKIIDEVLLQTDQNLSWLDAVGKEDTGECSKSTKVPPEKFLDSQPLPKEGIICYFGAFSDQE